MNHTTQHHTTTPDHNQHLFDELMAKPRHAPALDDDDGSGETEYIIRITLVDGDDDDDEPTDEEPTLDHHPAPVMRW